MERVDNATCRGLFEDARLKIGRNSIAAMAVAFEAAVIVLASCATGILYHWFVYGVIGDVGSFVAVGAVTALIFVLPFLFREEYQIASLLEGQRNVERVFLIWNYSFLLLAMIGFVSKSTDAFSRGWLLLFYVCGLVALIVASLMVRRTVRSLANRGRLVSRRLMLVGTAGEIDKIAAEIAGQEPSVQVVAAVALPDSAGVIGSSEIRRRAGSALASAVAKARAFHVDDVVIFADWSRADLIHSLVEPFRALPVAIHLGASSVVGPFSDVRTARIATLPTLSLTAPPLSLAQSALKRALDIVVAGTALVLISPLLLTIAVGIKATSPGPVFFRQRRRGYNHQEFRIWKFRTMTTLDDGAVIKQATAGDARVTSIGRYLRRYSLDELPQLFNVLAGEMSLVGPRPHAVAHDELFEKRIAAYARRLNVRPGITGWAQVQGFRGATDTDEAMSQRVKHDLHYIDNWSLALDVYILLLTVFSPKARENAH